MSNPFRNPKAMPFCSAEKAANESCEGTTCFSADRIAAQQCLMQLSHWKLTAGVLLAHLRKLKRLLLMSWTSSSSSHVVRLS